MVEITRRRMLQTGAGSLALAAFAGPLGQSQAAVGEPVTLSVASRIIDVTGNPARVYGITQANGVAGLLTDNDKPFGVTLVNDLPGETLVHWHGLTPPSEQDGVPVLSQSPLAAMARYNYDFANNRTGTHWMHSHLGLQEQQLLAAPLIVRDAAEAGVDEQEVVVLLHDFSFRAPEEIYDGLRQGRGMAGAMDMGAMDMDHDMAETDAMDMNMDHGDGGMGGMNHVNDVEYDAYLANDRTLADPEVVRVDPGGRIRLRIINAAAATNYLIDLGALDGELIAVDGNAIAPLKRSTIELAIAQRADIRLSLPTGQGAYPILARREDGIQQTGIVLATRDGKIDRLPDHTDAKTPVFDLTLEEQLVALSPLAARAAERTHTLDMTGRHDGYHWGFNGKVFNPDDPIHVTEGERVELVLRNDTNMHHPIHLHGHHFQVVAVDGRRFSGAVRDTVLVPPSRTVTVAFDADNPGHWALHCHQLYHMAAGMMTSILYEGYQKT